MRSRIILSPLRVTLVQFILGMRGVRRDHPIVDGVSVRPRSNQLVARQDKDATMLPVHLQAAIQAAADSVAEGPDDAAFSFRYSMDDYGYPPTTTLSHLVIPYTLVTPRLLTREEVAILIDRLQLHHCVRHVFPTFR
jgi:hypothetical protein